MKTDYELLELAAKVVGLLQAASEDADMQQHLSRWSPLEKDDDAFRLAVDAGIHIVPGEGYVEAVKIHRKMKQVRFVESHGGDARAATRRAIVVAAAHLGEVAK